MSIKFTILGCGSSLGIPRIDGFYGNCDPKNKKNIRSRCSALISSKNLNILIDTSPDLKSQLLKKLQPKIPIKGRDIRPLESLLLPFPSLQKSEFFDPRQCLPKGTISSLAEGPSWTFSVQGANTKAPSLKITTSSTYTKTLFPSSRLGTICSMAPPSQHTELSSPEDIHWDKVKRIQNQVKLDPEFECFENGLHDIILKYQNCVSWNGEPGRTNLGETEICTGGASPVFIPPNRFSPDVAKIVEKH